MKIEALEREWEIAPVNFDNRRKLHGLNLAAFAGDEVDYEKYERLLTSALVLSGIPDKDLAELSDIQLDILGQAIVKEYLGLSKKTNGDSV